MMTILYQLLATSIISYVCIILGIMYTLPSSTLKLFSSENTTLNRIMTETELSLMGSISSASTIIVMPFCGYLLDTLGRKRTIMLFYFPQLIGWLLLVSVFKVEAFIFTMFLCGLSGSIFLIVPIYIGEYSDPCIRGAMVSSSIVFHGLGMVISYIMGGVLDYNTINYIGLSMALIGLILLCFLKESPMYFMKKGFEEEALNSIAYYKGAKPNSTEVIKEKENMRSLLNADITLDNIPKEEKIPIWKSLAKSQSTRRSLFGLLVILTLCIFQGLVVLQILAEPLFEAIISIMPPTLSSVLFGIITVGAGFIGAYLIDTAGRRLLLIASSIATGFFSAILGTQIDLNWGPNWLSAVLIYFYSITFTIGPGSIPLVLVSEIFLPEIKSFATMVYMEWAFTCNFVILFIVNPLINTYGLGPLFYLFAGFSFLTAIFSFIYLPETKGLPADIIQLKFLEQKGYNTVTFN